MCCKNILGAGIVLLMLLISVPAILLPIQLPVSTPGEQTEDGPHTWSPHSGLCYHMGEQTSQTPATGLARGCCGHVESEEAEGKSLVLVLVKSYFLNSPSVVHSFLRKHLVNQPS